MNISIIGSRGIPAKYGGFETFTEQLSIRLVKEGHNVSVSCEYPDSQKLESYKGVRLRYFPFPPPKSYLLRKLYEIFNDIYFISTMAKSSDIMYILGVGTAGWFTFFPRFIKSRLKILVNIDGLEWKRDKFSSFEKLFIKINNNLAIRWGDIVIIDSKKLKNYVDINNMHKTVFISYGISSPNWIEWDKDRLLALSTRCNKITSVNRNNYWLVVARIEPENNIHTIIDGFLKSNSKKPLILVGEYTSTNYKKKLDKILDQYKPNSVLMIGSIYQDKNLLNMLRQNCFAYIHGHSVGGTNPSLLEAMIMKNIIVAHDNEFNREVCDNCALYFKDAVDLALKIELIEKDYNSFIKLKDHAQGRVITEYSWEKIANDYNDLFNILKNK